nr:NUDIX domain-containing protein [Candidatus Levybacteria bacterium]
MIYEREPVGFSPDSNATVSGCFIESKGEFLLLKRQPEKSHPNKWALPGGKADGNETPQEAIVRESIEETEIDLSDRVKFFKTMYERYLEADFVYHIFHALLDKKPEVVLSPEHTDYKWVSPSKALQMDLIEDLDICINMVYPFVNPAVGE